MFSIYPLNKLIIKHLQYRLDNCFKVSKVWNRDLQYLLKSVIPTCSKEELMEILTMCFKNEQFKLLRFFLEDKSIPVDGVRLTLGDIIIKHRISLYFDHWPQQIVLHVTVKKKMYCFILNYYYYRISRFTLDTQFIPNSLYYIHLYFTIKEVDHSFYHDCKRGVIEYFDVIYFQKVYNIRADIYHSPIWFLYRRLKKYFT